MNFGFRYHLASLMAVFLSLIMGILIGGAVFQDNGLIEEQGILISEMEARFQDIQANLGLLQTELDFSRGALSDLRDVVVVNRLAAKTVVLVDGEAQVDQALENTLKLSGADLKKIRIEDMASISPTEDFLFVFNINNVTSSLLLDESQRLAEAGAHLAFVWNSQEELILSGLPTSLQVDSVDTILGEIALILGLASGTKGRYGIHKGAERLFP